MVRFETKIKRLSTFRRIMKDAGNHDKLYFYGMRSLFHRNSDPYVICPTVVNEIVIDREGNVFTVRDDKDTEELGICIGCTDKIEDAIKALEKERENDKREREYRDFIASCDATLRKAFEEGKAITLLEVTNDN